MDNNIIKPEHQMNFRISDEGFLEQESKDGEWLSNFDWDGTPPITHDAVTDEKLYPFKQKLLSGESFNALAESVLKDTESPTEYKYNESTYYVGATSGRVFVETKPSLMQFGSLDSNSIPKLQNLSTISVEERNTPTSTQQLVSTPEETSPSEPKSEKSFTNAQIGLGIVGLGAGVLAIAGGERSTQEKRDAAQARGEDFKPKQRWFMRAIAAIGSFLALDVVARGDKAVLGKFTAQYLNGGKDLGPGLFR